MTTKQPPSLETILQTPWYLVKSLIIAGLSLCGGAAILAKISGSPALDPLLISLVVIGSIAGAAALYNRPFLWQVWLAAGVIALLASFGLPAHSANDWDSMRMLCRVLAAVGVSGGIILACPVIYQRLVFTLFILFHLSSLLVAVTSPPATPWVTIQAAKIFYPYQTFMYLGNAYHFYSPEPGPSHHLFILIKYQEKGASEPKKLWIDLPNRKEHFRDPLGLTYYRRLSLTELVSQSTNAYGLPPSKARQDALKSREKALIDVPFPTDPDEVAMQYQLPPANYRKVLFPSYARHIFAEYSSPDVEILSVKMFKVQHRVIPISWFKHRYDSNDTRVAKGMSPYNPTTYYPYYLGEFNIDGDLIDPEDPLLYWLVPIQRLNADGTEYRDHMSNYVGAEFVWPNQPRSK